MDGKIKPLAGVTPKIDQQVKEMTHETVKNVGSDLQFEQMPAMETAKASPIPTIKGQK